MTWIHLELTMNANTENQPTSHNNAFILRNTLRNIVHMLT